MNDGRERWMLGTSYHSAMEDHLGVTLNRVRQDAVIVHNEAAKVVCNEKHM